MTIHWCGTGLSSSPGLRRLIETGHKVVVWNRTVEKAQEAVGDLGADIRAYSLEALAAALKPGDIAISMLPADQHVAMIRLSSVEADQAVSETDLAAVKAALTNLDPAIKFVSEETVGPKVSGELVYTSILAMVVTSVGIMLYIWMRFEWQFALGGVLALLHDVFITVGIFAFFQIKFDLTIVAALLTILGYSINDTVVVFDRLRENLVKYKTMPLRDVMNLSVNETLSRTIMTSLTTLLAVGSMMVFGGDVIRGFSFAIFMGVLLGTYSSVYVAKNIVLMIGLDRSEKPKNGRPSDHEFANIDA